MSHKVLEVQNSTREKAIKAWLAPAVYDVDYYQNDLANARALRHPRSCEWIFGKEEMGHFLGQPSDVPGNQVHEEPFLWIYAKPVCTIQDHCSCRTLVDLRLTKCKLDISSFTNFKASNVSRQTGFIHTARR